MYLNPKSKKIKISVGEFSTPPWLSISESFGQSSLLVEDDVNFAHETIQMQRKEKFSDYQTEFYVNESFEKGEWTLEISGRLDGLINHSSAEPVIEEIKTTNSLESLLEELDTPMEHPYGLQLATYGVLYKKLFEKLPELRLIVSSMDMSEAPEEVVIDNPWTVIEDFFDRRIEYIFEEAKLFNAHFERRKVQVEKFEFPYASRRSGQDDLCEFISENTKKRSTLVFQAPTGLGKTVASIYSSLAKTLERGSQLIYATPKNSQQRLVLETAELMQKNSDLISLQYSAREKICAENSQERSCEDDCPFKVSLKQKLKDPRYIESLVTQNRKWDRSAVLKLAQKERVCPYSLQQEFIRYCDLITLDFNHIIAPINSLERLLFGEPTGKRKPVLIVDEAHNLVQRSWDEYSPSLSFEKARTFVECLKLSDHNYKSLNVALEKYLGWFGKQKSSQTISPSVREVMCLELLEIKEEFNEGVRVSHELNADAQVYMGFKDFYFEFVEFLNVLTSSIESFGLQIENGEIKLLCYDPSQILNERFSEFYNRLFFSATLKPFDHYSRSFGFDEEEVISKEFTSPFDAKNRKIMMIPQVSTKRSKMSSAVPKVCQIIERIANVREANYLAFFPSYSYMRLVEQQLKWSKLKLIVQTPSMSLGMIQDQLEKLREGEGYLLMGVQGGLLSEGIDFVGDMAKGVFVVGPGLPAYSQENIWRRDYYEKKWGKGESAVFSVPGIGKSIQAAGRVIRSESDKGLIVMIDDRFLSDEYSDIFPKDWGDGEPLDHLVSKSILKDVSEFWDRN